MFPYGVNRGRATISTTCGSTEDINFNVGMTTAIGRKFGGVHGVAYYVRSLYI